MNPRRALVACALLAIVGLGLSGYLTYAHGVVHSRGGGRLICDLSPQVGCSAASQSEYSTILGIPISFLGSLYYAWVLVLGGWALKGREGERERPVLFYVALSGVGAVAYSVFLAWVSHAKIGVWCPFCVAMYVVNGGLLVASALGCGVRPAEAPGRVLSDACDLMGKPRNAAIVLVGFAVLGGLAAVRHRDLAEAKDARFALLLETWNRTPAIPMPLDGDEPTRGPADAPVQIVEFFDYQCSACKKVSPILERIAHEEPDAVRLVVEHLPLDPACVPDLPPVHEHACAAAAAALCAGEQGQYWEMHDLLFIFQADFGPRLFEDLGRRLNLDMGRYDACRTSSRIADRLKREALAGLMDLGLRSTPTVFINGRRTPVVQLEDETWMEGAFEPDFLRHAVAEEKRNPTRAPAWPAGRASPAVAPEPESHVHVVEGEAAGAEELGDPVPDP